MKQIYAALDPGQMKAVQQLDGPVMILACAGKLKTPQQPGETVLAYAVRAGNALGTSLLGTARTVSALRYGRHRPRRSDVRTAREIYASLRERLPMRHKLILALKRAFLCKNA